MRKDKRDKRRVCLNCGRPLDPGREVMLEMDCRTGKLYYNLPEELAQYSQGAFPFGPDCARQVAEDKP